MKDFGVSRVLEPKGEIPVNAWKIDNSEAISQKEIRIKLEKVLIARESFSQLCIHCGYDEMEVASRIMQIIEKRGKLHNPYARSGGILMGVVEEIGAEAGRDDIKAGDRVIVVSSLVGTPLKIEAISSIDFNYGQITCSGYAICFESTILMKYEKAEVPKYLLVAVDEAGRLFAVKKAIAEQTAKRIAIIGGSPLTTLLYGQLLVEYCGEGITVIAVMDRGSLGVLTKEEIQAAFLSVMDKIYYVDLERPIEAYQCITNDQSDSGYMDAVINLESISGSGTVATLLTKEGGMVLYVGLKNNDSSGVLIADSMGKKVHHYMMSGYMEEAHKLAQELAKKASHSLELLDQIYSRKKEIPSTGGRVGALSMSDASNTSGAGRKTVEGNLRSGSMKRIGEFVYQSPVTKVMVEEALNVAQYDCNVIVEGETGVGKEQVFNIIQQNSPRQNKACIKINCATIPENLAESEFFGYEGGSFTGAQTGGKEGYFGMANGGTLFLDEIASLSWNMQSKLLRVLQENTYYRIGGTGQRYVDVRVICANNIPLKTLVAEGKFRKDLYYRLNICVINVPPLRERREDIVCLSEAFLKNYNKKYGVEKEISPEALQRLAVYSWPGNVRELENIVHRLYISQRGRIIEAEAVDRLINQSLYGDAVMDIPRLMEQKETVDFNRIIEQQERQLIAYALEREGTTRKAAEFLNLPQTTLARKKLRYGL
ncbi:MAG: sigma-54-dependent Fis family transcriptional regulator [Firmicutes bacterium]|nr:sigma-54-dependent Fis family transcriptional regulator [Bacillota bacterium]